MRVWQHKTITMELSEIKKRDDIIHITSEQEREDVLHLLADLGQQGSLLNSCTPEYPHYIFFFPGESIFSDAIYVIHEHIERRIPASEFIESNTIKQTT